MRRTGDRLNARMTGSAAADWGTRAADGALIFVQYNGRADFSDPAAPGPVYTTPRFEAGDERYAWLNKIQSVMKGRSDGRTLIAYRLYELRQ